MLIKIDDREDNLIYKELGELDIICYPERLKIGDYVYKDICVERKTVDDFCLSIMDGRIKKQVEAMQEAYKDCYVLIHGRIADRKTEIGENSIVGMLVSLVENGVRVIWVDNAHQAAYALKRLFERTDAKEIHTESEGGKGNGI